ncbi:asparagine synthase (glutamine-hydrolyzing) [Crossiella sp. SN42]|uniref:asparagine synthase (glutamine-hydrolyzing) n=1 Tax=Crossiella sp. SN42 TaxID=2944808 RepID=UPI00207D38B6|nr:asparagine synthase (glutamine-hydrolyzing) [Crossiella sp. SN42]MCO1575788.1 asparagine synthase (glutamine-hydrolyzing) [Crossiella sp. SN42]
MCGITGWIAFDRDLTQERQALEAMTDTMCCRGPDDGGAWVRRHVAFGHRRLAIIDLAGGKQPMSVDTPDGEVALTYSGEVYNYVELRDELRARGHRFTTASDTEVVLRAYLEWGPEFAEKLNGMYAFGIWDARSDRLVLVRDRLGIKPLYYYPTEGGLLFGSESRAILAHPEAETVINLEGMREMFGACKTPGHGVWAGMREVRPGGLVLLDRSGLRERVYWKLTPREHTADLDTTIGEVRDLLGDIVRRQLVSDVPRCVLLSGGLDSSSLTAVAARELAEQGERARSFTVDFTGLTDNFQPDSMRGTPDSPYAREVAAHVGAEHRDIVLSPDAMLDPETRAAVVRARGFPIGIADVDVSLYQLFKAIREHSTVALSGEGADEVFAGYPWFHIPAIRESGIFPWMMPLVEMLAEAEVDEIFNDRLSANLDLETYIQDQYRTAVAEIDRFDGDDDDEHATKVLKYLHITRFLPLLLDRKDRISMAVGLEVRVPFCDHRLVEQVYSVPWDMMTFDRREKSLLRAATGPLLPDSVAQRVKSPYPATQDPRYAAELQRMAKELLAGKDHPVFEIMNRKWVEETMSVDPAAMPEVVRESLDRVLDAASWLEVYRPRLDLG